MAAIRISTIKAKEKKKLKFGKMNKESRLVNHHDFQLVTVVDFHEFRPPIYRANGENSITILELLLHPHFYLVTMNVLDDIGYPSYMEQRVICQYINRGIDHPYHQQRDFLAERLKCTDAIIRITRGTIKRHSTFGRQATEFLINNNKNSMKGININRTNF